MCRANQPTVRRDVRMMDKTDAHHTRRDFLDEFQPLAAHGVDEGGEARDVPAGAVQTRDQSTADRIAKRSKHDGYRLGLLPRNFRSLIGAGHDHTRRQADQFSGESPGLLGVAAGPPLMNLDVAVIEPAERLQPLPHRENIRAGARVAREESHED